MSAKAIREATGKTILRHQLEKDTPGRETIRTAPVGPDTDWDELRAQHPWLSTERLVAKPDCLIKRRGQLGLVAINLDFDGAVAWIKERMGTELQVGAASGILRNFVIEPFIAHEQTDEYYVCIYATPTCDVVLFHHEGGVDIGDVDAKATKVEVPVKCGQLASDALTAEAIATLLAKVPAERQGILSKYIANLYLSFVDLHFTYLEINPLVVVGDQVYMLDLAAKLDQTAEYICHEQWGAVDFPAPFGRDMTKEERYIADLDSKSGASLKLTVLNPAGRVWTMVAGGGASVIYSDTICDLGYAAELANYGEYSGAPSASQTYEYAKTILSLMTKEAHPEGKILIIGGGIANFTNVAATFNGVIKALREFQKVLLAHNVRIFVRRGGPNYQEGLKCMRNLAGELKLPMFVYGPETHMTAVISMALGLRDVAPEEINAGGVEDLLNSGGEKRGYGPAALIPVPAEPKPLFSADTRCMLFGIQPRAVQGMLDFDFCCGRKEPSVAGMIYPFSGNHQQKFYWGNKEILVPVYKDMDEAMAKHRDVDVLINFASFRSAYDSTLAALSHDQIRVVSIIAEGIPENLTRQLNQRARDLGKTIIGPATVGGIKAGCFRIGNTGGMIDNILSSKLYRPGSVAYVSRSGGMSNELNNIISRHTNGVREGVAIGGDRYPGSTFIDHLLRFQDDPNVKMLVLLGEVGGVEEYKLIEALKSGRINKPVVAWCIGTCSDMFASEVQFGHAGSCAGSTQETAVAKNKALAEAGAVVPKSFDGLDVAIRETFEKLVAEKVVVCQEEPPAPKVPLDYKWAQELGLIRKPASFVSSVADERGEELLYAGMPITDVFKEDIGIGGVVSLLWFQRRLPDYACKFIEMCLMVTADHGPAVSGAHNTIVTARAGKDLVSSLCSGLLTIGDRFGGALDGAAKMFSEAYDAGQTPRAFVEDMRRQHKLIMGIGHRVKSLSNPDLRVVVIKDYVRKHFPRCRLLDYAEQVEKITTAKKPNLILNVDGAIAVCFVDMLRECGAFNSEEANELIQIGALNGLFVLGRTTGFIGHFIDQKRLKQGLYRHPWDDIAYLPSGLSRDASQA